MDVPVLGQITLMSLLAEESVGFGGSQVELGERDEVGVEELDVATVFHLLNQSLRFFLGTDLGHSLTHVLVHLFVLSAFV